MLTLLVFERSWNSERHQDACGKRHLMAQITVIFMSNSCSDSGAVVK